MKKLLLLFCAGAICSCAVKAPEAILPVPAEEQISWQEDQMYAFIHFGTNTFLDREWGYGDADPSSFNPTDLDCDQWARVLKQAGMKGIILTAKHHDGFCLWPTAYTDYNISASPYKGDIVGELSAACARHGLKFGLYLSPWDRHQACYAGDEYVSYYHNQLKELLSNYGPVIELWLDGANGGDGWYGGACEKRSINAREYYKYDRIYGIADSLQKGIVIFSDGGPGCRWVGNEKGIAGETNWAFQRSADVYAGYPHPEELVTGHADGDRWTASECDVSIRPGWFYHESQDSLVKTPEQLLDLYYKSVGRNGKFLLNFPPDRRGLIHPTDSANAVDFYRKLCSELSEDLLAGEVPSVSDCRGRRFSAKHLTDGSSDTYWATSDDVAAASVEFCFDKPVRMNRLMIQEYVRLGQRVKAFSVEYFDGSQWHAVDAGEATTTIGFKRILRFGTLEALKLRINITDSRACICLNNISAFLAE